MLYQKGEKLAELRQTIKEIPLRADLKESEFVMSKKEFKKFEASIIKPFNNLNSVLFSTLTNEKTEDTTIEQWYEENKIIYDRYFDKENERYVDEEKTASFLSNNKEIVGAGSFIGPYRQRLFYYEIDQKNRTFDVCYVSVNSEGKPDNICYATLSIPDEIEYDTIRYAFFGGSGGSNETGVTFSVKNGNEEYYMNIYIAAIKDEVYICDIYIGDDSAY